MRGFTPRPRSLYTRQFKRQTRPFVDCRCLPTPPERGRPARPGAQNPPPPPTDLRLPPPSTRGEHFPLYRQPRQALDFADRVATAARRHGDWTLRAAGLDLPRFDEPTRSLQESPARRAAGNVPAAILLPYPYPYPSPFSAFESRPLKLGCALDQGHLDAASTSPAFTGFSWI